MGTRARSRPTGPPHAGPTNDPPQGRLCGLRSSQNFLRDTKRQRNRPPVIEASDFLKGSQICRPPGMVPDLDRANLYVLWYQRRTCLSGKVILMKITQLRANIFQV